MSAREWTPGDVARHPQGFRGTFVQGYTAANQIVNRANGCTDPHHKGEHDHWHYAYGGWDRRDSPMSREGRPLVVIDPEDDNDDVSRLWRLLPNRLVSIDQLQDALREFADPTPPKPDEPMGKYAVVEDTDGVEWVRIDPAGFGWQRLGDPSTEHNAYASWDGFDAVRVLSEGVPS
jgi:hypothetical protein